MILGAVGHPFRVSDFVFPICFVFRIWYFVLEFYGSTTGSGATQPSTRCSATTVV